MNLIKGYINSSGKILKGKVIRLGGNNKEDNDVSEKSTSNMIVPLSDWYKHYKALRELNNNTTHNKINTIREANCMKKVNMIINSDKDYSKLPLPLSYKNICTTCSALDTSINLFNVKGKSLVYDQLKCSVEDLSKL